MRLNATHKRILDNMNQLNKEALTPLPSYLDVKGKRYYLNLFSEDGFFIYYGTKEFETTLNDKELLFEVENQDFYVLCANAAKKVKKYNKA